MPFIDNTFMPSPAPAKAQTIPPVGRPGTVGSSIMPQPDKIPQSESSKTRILPAIAQKQLGAARLWPARIFPFTLPGTSATRLRDYFQPHDVWPNEKHF